jgi:hypothetical protein
LKKAFKIQVKPATYQGKRQGSILSPSDHHYKENILELTFKMVCALGQGGNHLSKSTISMLRKRR